MSLDFEVVELSPSDENDAIKIVSESFATSPESTHLWMFGKEWENNPAARQEAFAGVVKWEWHSVFNHGKILGVKSKAVSPDDKPILLGVAFIETNFTTGLGKSFRDLFTLFRAGAPLMYTPAGRKIWGDWPCIRMNAGLNGMEKMRVKSRIERPHEWTVSFLATRHGYDGKGIGSALLKLIFRLADQAGVSVALESSQKNSEYYEKRGFKIGFTETVTLADIRKCAEEYSSIPKNQTDEYYNEHGGEYVIYCMVREAQHPKRDIEKICGIW